MWRPFDGSGSKGHSRARQREWEHELEERERFLQEKARLAEMGIDLDAPQEDLVCPSCRSRYDFGHTCPECGVVLVGESCLPLVEPEKPLYRSATPRALELVILLLALAAAFGVSGYLWVQFV